jgi:hypothetical protein
MNLSTLDSNFRVVARSVSNRKHYKVLINLNTRPGHHSSSEGRIGRNSVIYSATAEWYPMFWPQSAYSLEMNDIQDVFRLLLSRNEPSEETGSPASLHSAIETVTQSLERPSPPLSSMYSIFCVLFLKVLEFIQILVLIKQKILAFAGISWTSTLSIRNLCPPLKVFRL